MPAVAPVNSTALVLNPPDAVAVVEEHQAVQAVPVSSEEQAKIEARAKAFVEDLASVDMQSPAFTEKVNSIILMGDSDIRRSSAVSNRMLDRPSVRMDKDSPQGKVAKTLTDLRNTVTDLDPHRADLTGVKKLLKWLPGGNKVDHYFAKYQSAQSQLDDITRSLASGQDELRKDNASIDVERTNMWTTMQKLGEYNQLATALDGEVQRKVAELDAAGRTDDSRIMQSDVLFAVRQRRQDIATQMAVSVQGYLALDLVRKNNLELIRGVDRAQTTTLSALRTAVITSQALGQQKLVLDQISALNATTSSMIEATSEQLKTQGVQIQEQAASSTIEVDRLEKAFDNVFQAMDEIDTFRVQAAQNMQQTIGALQNQIERSKPYMERSMRQSGDSLPTSSAGNTPQIDS
ncbi:toxic anion resistance protein [Branchiibius sp. NY16-3462-2]|nr:toxic anion resistance protein [Branchiibius sp. NY16-3462-2]